MDFLGDVIFRHQASLGGDVLVLHESPQGCSDDTEVGWTDELLCLFLIRASAAEVMKLKQSK